MSPLFCRWCVVVALAAIRLGVVQGADQTFDKKLALNPALAPKKCAGQPPDELLKTANLSGTSSYLGEDAFFIAYEGQLRKYNDEQTPEVKVYRKDLRAAFTNMFQYILLVFGNARLGHDDRRVGAWVEWVICKAEKDKFRTADDVGCSAGDVEQYALEVRDHFDTGVLFDDQALSFLHDSIRHLIKATQDRTGDQILSKRSYFACALYDFLKKYDHPEWLKR